MALYQSRPGAYSHLAELTAHATPQAVVAEAAKFNGFDTPAGNHDTKHENAAKTGPQKTVIHLNDKAFWFKIPDPRSKAMQEGAKIAAQTAARDAAKKKGMSDADIEKNIPQYSKKDLDWYVMGVRSKNGKLTDTVSVVAVDPDTRYAVQVFGDKPGSRARGHTITGEQFKEAPIHFPDGVPEAELTDGMRGSLNSVQFQSAYMHAADAADQRLRNHPDHQVDFETQIDAHDQPQSHTPIQRGPDGKILPSVKTPPAQTSQKRDYKSMGGTTKIDHPAAAAKTTLGSKQSNKPN